MIRIGPFTGGKPFVSQPSAAWGSSEVGQPERSTSEERALAITLAPLSRSSAAIPPAWSKWAWLFR